MISAIENNVADLRQEPNRFLARQPILDRKQHVIGYEILFRSGWTNCFSGDGDDATRKVLDSLLVSGIDSICGKNLAFVNCTRESLLSGLVTVLPSQSTVLEILENVEPDDELIAACRLLKAQGYRIALDDFVLRESMTELVKLANYIKVDMRASSLAEKQSICHLFRNSEVSLLAEKVESEAEFRAAAAEGFVNFQGYFFCYPVIIARHEIPPSRLNAIRLLCALSKVPLDFDEVEFALKSDPALCYRLLRLANSPLYPVHGRITNVRHALMLVGERETRKLVMMALAASLGRHSADALLQLSIQRARFCELIAPYLDLNPTEQYLLGLLSAADAFLALPMSVIVERLPLRAGIQSALLGKRNAEARPLSIARRFERGDWDSNPERDVNGDLSHLKLFWAYAESVRWTNLALFQSASSRDGSGNHQDMCPCVS